MCLGCCLDSPLFRRLRGKTPNDLDSITMPFPFTLPTTSHLTFQTHLLCSTHPSLPSSATSIRSVLRSTLKVHKRLPESQQPSNLRSVNTALLAYLPYLLTIDAALSGKPVAGEDVDIALASELEVEWRPTLSASAVPGRDAARVKGRGLDYEIYSVVSMLAILQSLLARDSILSLYASTVPTPEQRLGFIQNATKAISTANAVNSYLQARSNSADSAPSIPSTAVDLSPTVQAALQSYTLAETTLLFVLKDDPYPALLAQARNKNDKEWMIKAPEISKVRAHLLARLCLSASEHAGRTLASLKSDGGKVSKEFVGYCEDLRSAAQAKACRFFGLDADVSGKTGEAIAWLHAGLNEVGLEIPNQSSKSSFSMSKLKNSLSEKREERLLAKGKGKWGADAGKAEEGRILEWLEKRWSKMNDTMNVQIVPEWRELAKNMPSGRDMPTSAAWTPPLLDDDELARMRAPPEVNIVDDESSGDEDLADQERPRPNKTPGSFPGDDSQGGSYY
jgi:hypothetical protein